MKRYFLSVLGVLLAAATSVSSQQIEWRDPSPHMVKFVTVEEDVKLEVLDWGGSGPALVLLAGLGDTAHVFDDFAPTLAARHRVMAITRRAHGRSSTPPTGYGFVRLAEDVMRVIDTMGVSRPIVIGHSFAGEEMHVLGARYSERIAGLVYLDAAFDRGDHSDEEAFNAVARTLPAAPRPTSSDLQSFTNLRSFLMKTQSVAGPEAHLRARFLTNPDGSVGSSWAPDLPIRQAISGEMAAAVKSYNPERIRVPALAMYAVPKSATDLMRPWYTSDDLELRGRVEKLFALTRARFEGHANWFKKFAAQGRVTEISGEHHLCLSNPSEVLQQIEAFASTLQ
jgi:pimeloyl-ACP methyl ester carboxylesterase